jgi:anti-anti-sigma factor
MQSSIESSDRRLVVAVTGRLDFGTSGAFQRVLESALAQSGHRALIIDCTGLDYVSSVGLRSFLIGARAAQAVGVRFLLCGLQPPVAEVFRVSGFGKVIETMPDLAAAEAAT